MTFGLIFILGFSGLFLLAPKNRTKYRYDIKAASGFTYETKYWVNVRDINGYYATKSHIVLYFILNETERSHWVAEIYEKCDANSKPVYLGDELFIRYSQVLGYIKPSDPYPKNIPYPFNANFSDFPILAAAKFYGNNIKGFDQPGAKIELPPNYPLLK